MSEAVTNTSPLVYLFHVGGLPWLESLFTRIWLPTAVAVELDNGIQEGYELPDVSQYPFLEMVEPEVVPSEWLVRDLGAGELAAVPDHQLPSTQWAQVSCSNMRRPQ